MPSKGSSSAASSHHSSPSHYSSHYSSPNHTFNELRMDEDLHNAEHIILKWDPKGSNYSHITFLWHESRKEANDFLKSVTDLQKIMQHLVSTDSNSQKIVRSQYLMQIAVKRLENEFYQILSASRDDLAPESVSGRSSRVSARSSNSDYDDDEVSDDDQRITGQSVNQVEKLPDLAMADLKSIAECMISSGFSKECVKIYNITRKSIVDEGLYRLGIERLNLSQIQKLDWDVAEMKIKTWVNAMKVAVKKLFSGERFLCDHVFSVSDVIRESCFNEITRERAIQLFAFPENIAKSKKSPEKMFRFLDMYESLSELLPEIETIFSFESSSGVRSHVYSSMTKLCEAVKIMLHDFESAIQKDFTKNKVPGGGLHPLSRYVMNYLCFLAEYDQSLADITADWPLHIQNPLPEDYYFENSNEDLASSVSVRFSWLILVLLCKLDGKAVLYKDVSLSYLFLMNNLQYIVGKVRDTNLRFFVGDNWIVKHDEKVRQYAANYEKMSWIKVTAFLYTDSPDMDVETMKECFRRFNSTFDGTYQKQASWVVPNQKLRDELKISISQKIVSAYRTFYDKYTVYLRGDKNAEALIKFSPELLGNRLSDLFSGTAGGINVSGRSSSPSHFLFHSHA